jgi:hypothetical protein
MASDSEIHDCLECGARVKVAFLLLHNRWHAKVQPELEEPTSEFGFWDPKGRWNANSQRW